MVVKSGSERPGVSQKANIVVADAACIIACRSTIISILSGQLNSAADCPSSFGLVSEDTF